MLHRPELLRPYRALTMMAISVYAIYHIPTNWKLVAHRCDCQWNNLQLRQRWFLLTRLVHLRRHLRHFFELMSTVTLNKNLFHLSNNYVIIPIVICARDNICWPTSHRDRIKAKLCCSAAICCCFQHIMNERVANSDSLIIFSAPTYFFDLNWQISTHVRGRFTQ
jgi:hypothetical protein